MRHALGIDVGGTTVKVGVVTSDGELIDSVSAPTDKNPVSLLRSINELRIELLERPSCRGLDICETVGLVVPGIVDEAAGVVHHSVNLGWEGLALREIAEAQLAFPVAFGHDVRAGALAENRRIHTPSTTVYVAIGTGISAALSIEGHEVVSGGWAGEIGQELVLDPFTGHRTPLERVSSASAIARRYSTLTSASSEPGTLGAKHVVSAVERGDKTAILVLQTAVEYLAESLAQVCALLGPVHFIIGGGLSEAGDALMVPLEQEVHALISVAPLPTFSKAQLGSSSQIVGAALKALDATNHEEST